MRGCATRAAHLRVDRQLQQHRVEDQRAANALAHMRKLSRGIFAGKQNVDRRICAAQPYPPPAPHNICKTSSPSNLQSAVTGALTRKGLPVARWMLYFMQPVRDCQARALCTAGNARAVEGQAPTRRPAQAPAKAMMPETLTSVMIGAPDATSHVSGKENKRPSLASMQVQGQQQAAAQGPQGLECRVLPLSVCYHRLMSAWCIPPRSHTSLRRTLHGAPHSAGSRHAGHWLVKFSH